MRRAPLWQCEAAFDAAMISVKLKGKLKSKDINPTGVNDDAAAA